MHIELKSIGTPIILAFIWLKPPAANSSSIAQGVRLGPLIVPLMGPFMPTLVPPPVIGNARP